MDLVGADITKEEIRTYELNLKTYNTAMKRVN